MMKEMKHNITKENVWFYIFLIVFALDGIISSVTCFLTSYSIKYQGTVALFKIPSMLEFLIAIFFIVVISRKISFNALSLIFAFFLCVGMFIGVIKGQLNSKFVVHIFVYAMPIIMMSFAFFFWKEYKENIFLQKFIKKIMFFGLIIYGIFTVLFRILYQLGYMRANSYGASWGEYSTPFFYTGSNPFQIIVGYLCILLNAMTGKRATLVLTMVIFIAGICMTNRKKKVVITHFVFCGIGLILTLVLVKYTGVFDRIIVTLTTILGNNNNWYAATSGRNVEIEEIVTYINGKPWQWITGIGFGGRVWIQVIYRHYSHFTPLGYIMTSGIFGSLCIYGGLCWNCMKGFLYGISNRLNEKEKPFIVLLFTAIIASFFGSSLFTTPIWWFFIGVALAILQEKKRAYKNRRS